jgi:hypothetical protein
MRVNTMSYSTPILVITVMLLPVIYEKQLEKKKTSLADYNEKGYFRVERRWLGVLSLNTAAPTQPFNLKPDSYLYPLTVNVNMDTTLPSADAPPRRR